VFLSSLSLELKFKVVVKVHVTLKGGQERGGDQASLKR